MNFRIWITVFYGFTLVGGNCQGDLIQKSGNADCKVKLHSDDKGIVMRRCMDKKENVKSLDVQVYDVKTRWILPTTDSNRMLINSTFVKFGKGNLDVTLSTPANFYPLFCARITSSHSVDQNPPSEVNLQLHCLQRELKPYRDLKLRIKPTRKLRKRTARARHLAVELPGCLLKAFKNSPACKSTSRPRPNRPRFHVRQEGTRPSVRVTLSRSVYGPRDQPRDKELAYLVAIQKENGWGKRKRILKVKTLRWPKRNARFKHLEKRTTYQVLVWRRGEIRRYSKLINL